MFLAKPEIKPRKQSKGADIAGAKRNVIASKTIREAKATYEDEVCTHNISITNLTEMINENLKKKKYPFGFVFYTCKLLCLTD